MFTQVFNDLPLEAGLQKAAQTTSSQVAALARKPKFTLTDFPLLLSAAAQTPENLEWMAQRSHKLTQQRFGNTMQLFIPMYLSNLCYNKCTYCGFSVDNKYPRKTLTEAEILSEGLLLKAKGFQHLLLLTGEAQDKVGVPYIAKAIQILRPHFASIGIEIQPLETDEYEILMAAGADSLTVYQETYHRGAYAKYHLAGKKKNMDYRLDTADRGGKAGFYRMNIGALLGLYDWRYEALALAHHLDYLMKQYWQTKYALSFPRIRDMYGEFSPEVDVTDRDVVQFICAFRLVFPDLGISLSTREPAAFRDQLLKLGITTLSAESHTAPGGYSGMDAEGQFETSDHRSLAEIKQVLVAQGFEPVMKDWD
ncbi:MAG: 2-iminoacetate synthase ThiH [Candidatus Margulisiibacteriota bacterium]